MATSQLTSGVISTRPFTGSRQLSPGKDIGRSVLLRKSSQFRNSYALFNGRKLRNTDVVARSSFTNYTRMLSRLPVLRQRKRLFSEVHNRLRSDSSVQTSDMEDSLSVEEEFVPSSSEETVQ